MVSLRWPQGGKMTIAATFRQSRDVELLERCATAATEIRQEAARVIVGQLELFIG